MVTKTNTNCFLTKQLSDYNRWREHLIARIERYQDWIEQEGLAEAEDDLRVYELVEGLKSDELIVAIVGEFSRGKTELINGLFFADYNQRLLPAEAGRTTMCPTELRFDPNVPPCIKLLPIDTRKSSQTIAEYKQTSTYWTTLSLNLDSPDQLAETFQEIVKCDKVSIAEAQELGLYDPDAPNVGSNIQIPLWRHAVINYPHPLLEQGLVVLDTPGLNALGTEPELTMSMLPNAHVIIFVLGADTGVTRSDLTVWKDHVCVAKGDKKGGRIVVLNKIDTLWDELRGPDAVSASISRQTQETAAVLNISKKQIFATSAQKGLIGKINQDPELIERSGLPALERRLAEEIVPAKQALIREKIMQELRGIVKTTAETVNTRLAATNAELKELRGMSGKNQGVVHDMMTKKQQDQENYDKRLAHLDRTRQVLDEQVKMLLQLLSMEAFDKLIHQTRQDMKGSWTTHGLKGGMKTFFDGAMLTMDKVHKQAERIKGLVEAVYKQFQVGHGLAKLKLESFELQPYHKDVKRLYKEAETFRNSPTMVMTEQHFVVKKFFITLVSRARHIFDECNNGSQLWSKAIMAPVFARIREHKATMDQRIANLKKIHKSLDHLKRRIGELEATRLKLEKQKQITMSILPNAQPPVAPAEVDEDNTSAVTEVLTPGQQDDVSTERLRAARGAA